MTEVTRPSLDELIDQTALLPPGPEAWAPIFKHYPELTIQQISAAFEAHAERLQKEANELNAWGDRRFGIVPPKVGDWVVLNNRRIAEVCAVKGVQLAVSYGCSYDHLEDDPGSDLVMLQMGNALVTQVILVGESRDDCERWLSANPAEGA